MTAADLAQARCQANVPALPETAIAARLSALTGWQVVNGKLSRDFRFANHYETLAFVNAVAWISHRQDHHPDLSVGYNTCRVAYHTHSVGGLSENDFICAAKIDLIANL